MSSVTTAGPMHCGPGVSIVIPAFNAAETLEATLASVAAQTWRNFEAIVVDDGSTDATAALLATCEAKWPWLRTVRQRNAGAAAGRNRGIELARGEFVAFLDADDLWLPDKLALQMEVFSRNASVSCVYADEIDFLPDQDMPNTLFQEKPPARGLILHSLFQGNFVLTSTLVARKSALLKVDCFDARHRVYEDLDLFLRLAERFEFDYVDKVLVRRRLLPHSLMHANALACQQRDLEIIGDWVERHPSLFPRDSPLVRKRRASVYARMGDTLLSQGDFRAARDAYFRAIGLGQWNAGVLLRTVAACVPPVAKFFRRAKATLKRQPLFRRQPREPGDPLREGLD